MKKIINNLREQPEEIRRHLLHIIMIVLVLILFSLWAFSLGRTLSDSNTQEKVQEDLKPFSVLKDNLVEGYKDTTSETE